VTHAAITFIEVGRGLGRCRYPVVKMGTVGKSKTWHILDPNSPICGTGGAVGKTQNECNTTTIVLDGGPVCVKCRRALGRVPATEFVRPPINKSKTKVAGG
jgi:hypothetical protein